MVVMEVGKGRDAKFRKFAGGGLTKIEQMQTRGEGPNFGHFVRT